MPLAPDMRVASNEVSTMVREALPSARTRGGALALRERVTPLIGPASTAVLAAAAVAYIVVKNPHIPGATFVCPIATITGLYCPGCGGTRAVYDLAHGDILGALSMNPLVTVAVPLVAVLWIRWLMRGLGVRLRDWPFPAATAVVLPAAVVAFTVLRNVEAFAPYLAP